MICRFTFEHHIPRRTVQCIIYTNRYIALEIWEDTVWLKSKRSPVTGMPSVAGQGQNPLGKGSKVSKVPGDIVYTTASLP